MAFANALERTVGQFHELVRGTGWKLDYIKRNDAAGQDTVAVLIFNAI